MSTTFQIQQLWITSYDEKHISIYKNTTHLSWDHPMSCPVRFEDIRQDIGYFQGMYSNSPKILNVGQKKHFQSYYFLWNMHICFVKVWTVQQCTKKQKFKISWMMVDIQGVTCTKAPSNRYSNVQTGHAAHLIWGYYFMFDILPTCNWHFQLSFWGLVRKEATPKLWVLQQWQGTWI